MSNKDPRLIFWVAIHEKKTFNISRTDWYWVQWKAIQNKGNALEIRNLLQRTIEPDTHIFDVIIFCLEFIYLIHLNDVLRIIVQDIIRQISFFSRGAQKTLHTISFSLQSTLGILASIELSSSNIPFIAFHNVIIAVSILHEYISFRCLSFSPVLDDYFCAILFAILECLIFWVG